MGFYCNLCRFVAKSVIRTVLSRNLFCQNSSAFMWRKIEPKSIFVEEKMTIWGLSLQNSTGWVSEWVTDNNKQWSDLNLMRRVSQINWQQMGHTWYKTTEIKELNGKAKLLKALCDFLETYVKTYLEVACGRVKVIHRSFSWEGPPIAAAAVCSGCLY